MNDKITELLQKLLATDDYDEARAIAAEMRAVVHRHVEELREQISALEKALPQTQPKRARSSRRKKKSDGRIRLV